MTDRNGGRAFPRPASHASDTHHDGMSLRDWFAGQAMGGQLNNIDWDQISPSFIAETSYEIADAMLKERNK